MDRGLACHLLGKREPVICIRDLKRDRLHHWSMNMIDMRTPFTADDKSSELELRQIHAFNYMAARLGEIELHLGKIVTHLELIATAGGGVAQAIRDVGAPIRTMKK
jgi:hypothetical protein